MPRDETRAEKVIAVVVLIGMLVLWTAALMFWTPTRSLF